MPAASIHSMSMTTGTRKAWAHSAARIMAGGSNWSSSSTRALRNQIVADVRPWQRRHAAHVKEYVAAPGALVNDDNAVHRSGRGDGAHEPAIDAVRAQTGQSSHGQLILAEGSGVAARSAQAARGRERCRYLSAEGAPLAENHGLPVRRRITLDVHEIVDGDGSQAEDVKLRRWHVSRAGPPVPEQRVPPPPAGWRHRESPL